MLIKSLQAESEVGGGGLMVGVIRDGNWGGETFGESFTRVYVCSSSGAHVPRKVRTWVNGI